MPKFERYRRCRVIAKSRVNRRSQVGAALPLTWFADTGAAGAAESNDQQRSVIRAHDVRSCPRADQPADMVDTGGDGIEWKNRPFGV